VTVPVRLQSHVYNPVGHRRALLLHGLRSDGASWWRLASELAEDDYLVLAPDLRSHGRSPATADLSLAAFAADVAGLGDGYDLVVGHSLGGAVAALLLAQTGFAEAAVLIDPVLRLTGERRARAEAELREDRRPLGPDEVQAANPRWARRDVELDVLAARQVPPSVVEAVLAHNDPWDVTDAVTRWTARVHLVAADPALGPALDPDLLATLRDGDRLTGEVVGDAGHCIHRERPEVIRDAVAAVTRQETT
jgi:pimeloyl-ACP methyl ester carboxylesterase